MVQMRRIVIGVVGMALGLGQVVAQAEEEAAQAAPAAASAAPAAPAGGLTVQDNMDVAMEYTLTVDGAVVDSSKDQEPFHYVQGRREVIPGLEKAMQGLKVGDTKQITVTPEEGYGSVDPSAFAEIPKAQLPAGVSPEVGMVLRGVNPDGQSFQARVKEIKDQTVMLDLNHPLAGKTLNFDIKVTDIKPAPPQQ
jgi:FKBP-type peptidyl-prolyl cis-trans isomerase SlyD